MASEVSFPSKCVATTVERLRGFMNEITLNLSSSSTPILEDQQLTETRGLLKLFCICSLFTFNFFLKPTPSSLPSIRIPFSQKSGSKIDVCLPTGSLTLFRV